MINASTPSRAWDCQQFDNFKGCPMPKVTPTKRQHMEGSINSGTPSHHPLLFLDFPFWNPSSERWGNPHDELETPLNGYIMKLTYHYIIINL